MSCKPVILVVSSTALALTASSLPLHRALLVRNKGYETNDFRISKFLRCHRLRRTVSGFFEFTWKLQVSHQIDVEACCSFMIFLASIMRKLQGNELRTQLILQTKLQAGAFAPQERRLKDVNPASSLWIFSFDAPSFSASATRHVKRLTSVRAASSS